MNSDVQENLTLSVDVDKDSSRVLASDSHGYLTLVDLAAAEPIVRQWKAHTIEYCEQIEAWTCAFDRFRKNVLYSGTFNTFSLYASLHLFILGGDDSKFHVWDLRENKEVAKTRTTSRDAGVTSFLSHKENVLLVGSYDEKLSSYDLRQLKAPVDELPLNGGIWRIKPCSHNPNHLLVACMYHNFSVVESASNLSLVAEYFEHKSICYGCDWSPVKDKDYSYFATCSFYDHLLTVCKIKL